MLFMILYHRIGVIILHIEKAPSKDFKPFNDANLTYICSFKALRVSTLILRLLLTASTSFFSLFPPKGPVTAFILLTDFALEITLLRLTTFPAKML